MLQVACDIGLKKGLVTDDNDLLVVTAGFPFGTPGASNIIRVIPGKYITFDLSSLSYFRRTNNSSLDCYSNS